MIRFPKAAFEAIQTHARRDLPNEACGYLVGKAGEVAYALPMTNVDASPEHYTFDPQEQFNAYNRAKAEGLTLVGVYHSHPSTPARPSEEDIKLAYDPNVSYVIVSLAGEEPDVKSFRIVKGEVTPEPIKVVP